MDIINVFGVTFVLATIVWSDGGSGAILGGLASTTGNNSFADGEVKGDL